MTFPIYQIQVIINIVMITQNGRAKEMKISNRYLRF